MDYFEQKIAYLRGLCDGSGFHKSTKEGKIFHGMLQLLEDMAVYMQHCCEKEDEEAQYSYAFICPNCGEEIEVDEITVEKEEMNCPKCGNIIPVCATDIDELKF